MICSNCSNQQSTGKFCGKCGGALVSQEAAPQLSKVEDSAAASPATPVAPAAAAAPPLQAPADPNEHVEKVKETSKQYWNYFLQHLQKPGTIVSAPSKSLINSIVTMAVFVFIVTLILYRNLGLVLRPMDEVGGFFGSSQSIMPSFFSVLLSAAVFLGLVFVLSAASIFAVNKFAGPGETFKAIFASFGTLMIPGTVLMLAAYVLLLIESNVFGNFLVAASLILTIAVLPLYLMTALLMKQSKGIDSYYALMAYIVIFTVSFSIVVSIFFDSTIGKYLEAINSGFFF